MKMHRQKIDTATIAWAVDHQKQRISGTVRRAKLYTDDPSKKIRLEQGLCPVCFYESSRIGGAACSRRQCGLCDTTLHSGNTCIDVLCSECAKANGLCKHCGGDVNCIQRRKRTIPQPTPTIEDPN